MLSDTRGFYRFFDATPHAEFLYVCVLETIEEYLPNETNFLRKYDQFRAGVEALIDMPDHTINLLFRMLRQNNGRLSKRARESEFAQLTDEEARQIEVRYEDIFP